MIIKIIHNKYIVTISASDHWQCVTKGTGLGRDRLHEDDYSPADWCKEGNAAFSLVRNIKYVRDDLILSSNQSSDVY